MLRFVCHMLVGLALPWFMGPALAQPLSIDHDSAGNTWLQATSSSTVGYRFQASRDFQNWHDLGDAASGASSYRVDTTNAVSGFFRLRSWPTQDVPVTLAIVGDSTAADYAMDDMRFSGWGQGIYARMKPNVRVLNLAVPYQSSLSFLYSMQKDNLLKLQPEFVLIQFGFVDSGPVAGFHTSLSEFETNLTSIVQMVREFKGTPVLVTPTGVRYFDDAGKPIPVVQDRCEVVRKVAAELQTPLIDLNARLNKLYDDIGQAEVLRTIAAEPPDESHFSLSGAETVAAVVVEAFPGILAAQVVTP